MKKFISVLKNVAKSDNVYWIKQDGAHYVGCRYFAARFQHVDDNKRQGLASFGIFAPNTARTKGQESTAPTSGVVSIFKSLEAGECDALDIVDTGLNCPPGYKDSLRVLAAAESGDKCLVNAEYLEALACLYPTFPALRWQYGSIYVGNHNAILMPIQYPNVKDHQLDTWMKGGWLPVKR